MGYKIDTGAANGQLSTMNSSLSSLVTSIAATKVAVQSYVGNDALQSETYDALRAYYQDYHIPVLDGMLSYIDEMISANGQYSGAIGTYLSGLSFYDEDRLSSQLQSAQNILSQADVIAPAVAVAFQRLETQIREELQNLYDFVGSTGSVYANARSILDNVNSGLGVIESASFNPATNSFQVSAVVDMSWRDRLRDVWAQKCKEGMKGIGLAFGLSYLNGMPLCSPVGGDPVNLNTGNFIYEKEDMTIAGLVPLSFKRFYNSMDQRSRSMGTGWVHNYEVCLEFKNEKEIVILWDDGKEETFAWLEGRYYNGHTGLTTLEVSEKDGKKQYTHTTSTSMTHVFDVHGKELFRQDVNENRIEFQYDESGRLILASSGEIYLSYTYNDDGYLVKVADHTDRSVTLEYSAGRLIGVVSVSGKRNQYDYDDGGRLEAVTSVRGTVNVINTYDQQGRTRSQSFPDGGSMWFDYHDGKREVTLREQNRNKITYTYDERYRNIKTTYIDGVEQFAYNDQNKQTLYIDKNGNKTVYGYDRHGNKTEVTDALGNRWKYVYGKHNKITDSSLNDHQKRRCEYDAKGNILKSTDALGRVTGFTYNEQGLPIIITQPDGNQLSLSYDAKGNISSIVDSLERKVNYEYDSLNRVIKTMDGNNNVNFYAYDAEHNLKKVVNAEGNERSYTYNEVGKVTSIKDYNGGTYQVEYDFLTKPSKITDPVGNVTTFEYDNMWNMSKRTEANGAEVTFSYDLLNRLDTICNAKGAVTRFEYDGNGNKTKEVDAMGNETCYSYDALNRNTEIIQPNGARTVYAYTAEGQIQKVTDASGNETKYEYDSAGQQTRMVDALGRETRYAYTNLGKIKEVCFSTGQKVRYEYEMGGLLTGIHYPDGRWEEYQYDANRNLIRRWNQEGYELNYIYDPLNRVIQIQSNQDQVKSYTYDGTNNVTSMTDANGNVTFYTYNLLGLMTSVTDALGDKTEYQYDSLGNLIQVEQQGNPIKMDTDLQEVQKCNKEIHTTTYKRDQLGQIEQITDALGHQETYVYDAVGRITRKQDKDGFITGYEYNAMGDVSRVVYGDGKEVKYQYDALRQLREMEDWLGITRIELDPLGQAEKVTDHLGNEVSYEWGEVGERKSITYPDVKQVCYAYDDAMRLQEVADGESVVNYNYDSNSRLIQKNYQNGIKTNCTYNSLGHITSLIHQDQEGILDQYDFTYDAMGSKTAIQKQRRGLAEESGRYQYTYDSANRIHDVLKDGQLLRSYDYDSFGNRVKKSEGSVVTQYQYDRKNQLLHQEMPGKSLDYAYDNRGNLSEIVTNGKVSHQYWFSALDRLESVANHEQSMGASYQYNGFGNRMGRVEGQLPEMVSPMAKLDKLVMTQTKQMSNVIDFTKAHHNLLQRKDGNQVSSFVWDYDILKSTGTDGREYQYLQDEMGSPLRLLDSESQSRALYDYDEFGKAFCHTPDNEMEFHQPFTYTGYEQDSIANTFYAQAREYSPELGRFTSEDILKGSADVPGSLNSYVYCMNLPFTYIDPTGLATAKEGDEAHKALERELARRYPTDVDIEVKITKAGRADILYTSKNVTEVYEIKPGSYAPGAQYYRDGIVQRDKYINGINQYERGIRPQAVPGKSLQTEISTITCQSLIHPNRLIKYYTYPSSPGMVYWGYVNKKDDHPKPYPFAIPVPEEKSESEQEFHSDSSEDKLVGGLVAAGGLAAVLRGIIVYGIADDVTGIGVWNDPVVAGAAVLYVILYGDEAWKMIQDQLNGNDYPMG